MTLKTISLKHSRTFADKDLSVIIQYIGPSLLVGVNTTIHVVEDDISLMVALVVFFCIKLFARCD